VASDAVLPPTRGLALDHRRDQHLTGRQGTAPHPSGSHHIPTIIKDPGRSVEPGALTLQSDHDPPTARRIMIEVAEAVVQARACHPDEK
jgi:hypothetical protein